MSNGDLLSQTHDQLELLSEEFLSVFLRIMPQLSAPGSPGHFSESQEQTQQFLGAHARQIAALSKDLEAMIGQLPSFEGDNSQAALALKIDELNQACQQRSADLDALLHQSSHCLDALRATLGHLYHDYAPLPDQPAS